MPSKSAKEKLLDIKATEALRDIEIIEDQMDSGVDEILDDFIEDAIAIYSCRRGISIGVPKSIDWRNNILSSFGDGRFKQMLRVSKYQFANMVNLIKADEVFSTAGIRQIPVDLQLAIVLFRLGSSGSSASVRKICTIFGIGDGGTLAKITDRVFTAILRLMPKYIQWPNVAERQQLVERTFEELPHCLGYIDGSEIKLFEKPAKCHEKTLMKKWNQTVMVIPRLNPVVHSVWRQKTKESLYII
ncbi:hypothetical protein ACLKA6_002649 [Drosophila palustris]